MAQPKHGLGAMNLYKTRGGMSYFTRRPLVFVGRLYGVEARQSAFSAVVGRLFAWVLSNIRLGAFEYSCVAFRISCGGLSNICAEAIGGYGASP